jgi:small-conductance mechanosensitive channel
MLSVVRAAGAIALFAALALMAGATMAASTPPAPSSAAARVAEAAKPAGAGLSLAEMITAAETVDVTLTGISRRIDETEQVKKLSAEVEAEVASFASLQETIRDAPITRAGLYELVDLAVAVREASDSIAQTTRQLAERAKALDGDLDSLAKIESEWSRHLDTAKQRDAPDAISAEIRSILNRSKALAKNVTVHRNAVLGVLSQASSLQVDVTNLKAEVDDRRSRLVATLKTTRGTPLWRVEPRVEEVATAQAYYVGAIGRGLAYLRDHAFLLLAIGGLAFGLTYRLILGTRGRIAREAETDPRARETAEMFKHPGLAALVIAVLTLLWSAPLAPVIFYDILWAMLPFPAAILALALGATHRLSLFTLAGAIVSITLLGPLDLLPLASRIVLIAQCLAVAGAAALDLHRGRLSRVFSKIPQAIKALVVGAIILLTIAVVANIIGYIGVSRTLRNGVLGSLGVALVLRIAYHLLYGLSLALMQTQLARRLRIVQFQTYSVQRAARAALGTAAVLFWAAASFLVFGLLDSLVAFLSDLRTTEIAIGSATVSMEGVIAGLLVLVGTWVLVKTMRLVLEVELLPRLRLKAGVPFAISTITRYVLVTAGVVLAMSAMGVDLTKVTLLAGALGVGIGFGLQSIVNNFVSGLILLVERPINVGDTIQTQDLWGQVRRIGVRSSTVRTFQGAEVILPNADLITKEVTNWTLSDRQRRLEIDVGVAYGSDPERVVRLLEAAAKEVKEVMSSPPPWAWFTGFGDSSLNFRLQAWIEDYDRGLAIQSALRVEILKKLNEAEIEIPFPQRDIHIRSTVAPPAGSGFPGPENSARDLAAEMPPGAVPNTSADGSAPNRS